MKSKYPGFEKHSFDSSECTYHLSVNNFNSLCGKSLINSNKLKNEELDGMSVCKNCRRSITSNLKAK